MESLKKFCSETSECFYFTGNERCVRDYSFDSPDGTSECTGEIVQLLVIWSTFLFQVRSSSALFSSSYLRLTTRSLLEVSHPRLPHFYCDSYFISFFLFPTSFHRPTFFSLVHYFYTHGPSYHSNLINLILFLLSRDHLDLLSFIAFLVPFFRFISGHSSFLITHVDDPCQHTVRSLKTNVSSVLQTD